MPLIIPASTRRAFDRLGQDLVRVLVRRFVAFVASSQTASVAFSSTIEAGDLVALGALVESWHHEALETTAAPAPDAAARMPAYLAAAEALWAFVDQWQRS